MAVETKNLPVKSLASKSLKQQDVAVGASSEAECEDRVSKERTPVTPYPVTGPADCSDSTPKRVEPLEEWSLEECAKHERALFDTFATEQVERAGTEVEYYVRDLGRSTRDPLYDELLTVAWVGPFRIKVHTELPESSPATLDQGFHTEWDGSLWIPRLTVEKAGMAPPQEGDVVRLWNLPYFNDEAVDRAPVPGRGYFFDVEKVDDDGHIADAAEFVGWKVQIKRRTEFTPERRLTPP